jgi:3-dehydroquinate synthase
VKSKSRSAKSKSLGSVIFKTQRKNHVLISKSLTDSLKEIKKTVKGKRCVFVLADQTFLSEGEYLMRFTNHLKVTLGDQVNLSLEMVPSGEAIKSFESIESLATRLVEKSKGYSRSEISLIAVGGGSVGDAIGFLASVLKRGVQLINVPTTYLAAIDSAHGGKTAINVGGFKNQIGTFYPAELTVIDKEFFKTLSRSQLTSALGELFKIAIIEGGSLWKDWEASSLISNQNLETEVLADKIWSLLPKAVTAKLKVVNSDFEEVLGHRIKLNLGHTLGHAIEAITAMPHGDSVLVGCAFSIHLSRKLKLINQKTFMQLLLSTPEFDTQVSQLGLSTDALMSAMIYDKKAKSSAAIDFVLVKAPGKVIVKSLTLSLVQKTLEEFLMLEHESANNGVSVGAPLEL